MDNRRFHNDGPTGERDYEDGGHIVASNALEAAKLALGTAKALVANQYKAAHAAFFAANKRRHNAREVAVCKFQLEKAAQISTLTNRVIMLGGR